MPSVEPRTSPCGTPLSTQLERHEPRSRNSPAISKKRWCNASIAITMNSAIAVSWPNALHTVAPAGSAARSTRSMPVATDCTRRKRGAGGKSARHWLLTRMSASAAAAGDPASSCGSAITTLSRPGGSSPSMPAKVSAATLPRNKAFMPAPSKPGSSPSRPPALLFSCATPQDLRRAAGTLRHRREFGPADRLVPDPGAEPAIGAGQHVLAADETGIAHQPLGHQIGVLDEVGAVADNAGNEDRAVGQLDLLEDAPFVLVARVGGLDRIAAGVDAEDQVDDVAQRNVVMVRPVKAAPADMQPHLVARDAAQRMVERVDPQRRIFAIVRERDFRQASPAVGQVGIVDLQFEPGVDNRAVFLVHRVGDREHELFVAFVIFVGDPMLDRARRIGRQERPRDICAGEGRAKVVEVAGNIGLAD